MYHLTLLLLYCCIYILAYIYIYILAVIRNGNFCVDLEYCLIRRVVLSVNPAYRDDSLHRDRVAVDMEGIRMEERRGSDGSREYCPEGSTRRRWAATAEPRDTADLINALPSRQLGVFFYIYCDHKLQFS